MRPSSRILLATLVTAALVPSQAVLSHRRQAPPGAGSQVVQAVQAVGDNATEDPVQSVSSALGDPVGNGKTLLGPVEIFRMMMCWGRPKLLDHEKCCDWMAHTCEDSTTGQGYCRRTREWAKDQCENGKEKDKERACLFASKMGVKVRVTASLENPKSDEELSGNMTLSPKNATTTKAPVADSSASTEGALPEQGFDEHSKTLVKHTDGKTHTGDWRAEWPMGDETEGQSTARICRDNPGHPWCKLFLKDRERRKNKDKRMPPFDAPEHMAM